MLKTHQLSKSFGKIQVLNSIGVQMQQGQTVALIGPNASGKTTFIKCLLGLVIPDQGSAELEGVSLLHQPEARRRIGYMPQIGRYPDNMRIGQIFDMVRDIRGMDAGADDDLVQAFGMRELADKRMRTLSGGTRQKVSACLAFMFGADVLILDEPTAGLDPISVEILKEKIWTEKQKGKLILITSHILADLDDLATDVMFITEGKLRFFKSINELKQQTGESRLNRAVAHILRQVE